jgi:hypothetical protein
MPLTMPENDFHSDAGAQVLFTTSANRALLFRRRVRYNQKRKVLSECLLPKKHLTTFEHLVTGETHLIGY